MCPHPLGQVCMPRAWNHSRVQRRWPPWPQTGHQCMRPLTGRWHSAHSVAQRLHLAHQGSEPLSASSFPQRAHTVWMEVPCRVSLEMYSSSLALMMALAAQKSCRRASWSRQAGLGLGLGLGYEGLRVIRVGFLPGRSKPGMPPCGARPRYAQRSRPVAVKASEGGGRSWVEELGAGKATLG